MKKISINDITKYSDWAEKLLNTENLIKKKKTQENVIREFNPTIIAISVLYSTLLDSAKNIAKIAKKINKNIVVIIGGNCVSNAVIDYKYSLNLNLKLVVSVVVVLFGAIKLKV